MDLSKPYRLSPSAAIRPERFGGLVYRYDNRKLLFLHSRDLVDFVGGLDGAQPLAEALASFLLARGLPATAQAQFVKALEQLERLEVVVETLQT